MDLNFDIIKNRRFYDGRRGIWYWCWFHPGKVSKAPERFREFFEGRVVEREVPDFEELKNSVTGYGGVEPAFCEDEWKCTGDFNFDSIRYAHENMDQGRHYRVLKALVADEDSDVVCCELPVWGTIEDGGEFVEHTGHIDAVEVKNGEVHVLDYKPDSDEPHDHARQVEAYRRLLALRFRKKGSEHPRTENIGVGIFNDEQIWRCDFPQADLKDDGRRNRK
ncbi:hypothetical protein AKJ66_01840 [candidate division MSBL1 archaeon SCGC-AAA259E22]|uniref:PD-(D/E)XK endonuclease-like domain-containing protein n=1 Tax=candidate division MSBL1 archaeon SCGC-AAA259E22 TaxID=1698265 RepID=A0A133UHB9_9EURY|nr:hypothetical protein AKJ66_01840 [candidate division MSBL1 archaeon SCGC-AAA259E22]